jgi:acetolactate decarboxylase
LARTFSISSAARKAGRYWSGSASSPRRPARADRAHGLPLSAHPLTAVGSGVRWIGAQRDVLGGDLPGHGDLEALSTASHLYALGPLEGLRGEVSIFDSVPIIARIEMDSVVTSTSWSARACFLVWAQVPKWSEHSPRLALADLDGIERATVTFAGEAGLDPSRPLPFRIRGAAVEATIHVLDKRDDLPHNPERHEKAKVRRILDQAPVELVGFYSRQHRGIFTPKESNVHVHLRTEDGLISGHLETIRLAEGARVAVPAYGWRQ